MKAYSILSLTSSGFFSDLRAYLVEAQIDVPDFLGDINDVLYLDRYYYYVRSGDKIASKIVRYSFDVLTQTMSANSRKQIAQSFWQIMKEQLLRQWEIYQAEYNPIHPYDVHEETDYTHGNISTVEDDGTVTVKKEGKEKTVLEDDDRTGYVYGFDSDPGETGGVESDRSTHGSEATITYGADDTERKDTRTLDTTKTSRDNSTDDLDTHKYGTLGTTSVGELLQKEFETWRWNFYLMVLFPAADKLLTIPIY